MLREEKVGMSDLSTDTTRRLPDAGGGEGRMWRGRQGGGSSSEALVAASAREAWLNQMGGYWVLGRSCGLAGRVGQKGRSGITK